MGIRLDEGGVDAPVGDHGQAVGERRHIVDPLGAGEQIRLQTVDERLGTGDFGLRSGRPHRKPLAVEKGPGAM